MQSSDVMRPACEADLCELIGAACAKGQALELRGGGSKADIGHPERRRTVIDLRGFAGIIDYDPGELVMTVGAGTALAEVERALHEQGQMLAFDPFDHGPLFGRAAGAATIGGIVIANICGPRRLSAGSARDHVLGVEAVSGRGESFKAGGRVVKNVTGYDLPRLLAGSWGRLAAVTRLSLKVLPRPRAQITVVIDGLNEADALALLQRAVGSSAEISAAAHLPRNIPGSVQGTLLRLEGFGPSVAARAKLLRSLCADAGRQSILEAADSARLWAAIRDAGVLPQLCALWRITLPAASSHRLGARLSAIDDRCRYFYDWAGGLMWVAAPDDMDVRVAAGQEGGQALLVRASAELRARTPVFHPSPAANGALRRRIEAAFDPAGIFDPQRFGARES